MIKVNIESPGREDRSAYLKAGTTIVGSDLLCDVVIYGDDVSGQHLRLTLTEISLQIEALGQHPTLILRGSSKTIAAPPNQKIVWQVGDRLALGGITISFEDVEFKSSPNVITKLFGTKRKASAKKLGLPSVIAVGSVAALLVAGFGFLTVVSFTNPAQAGLLAEVVEEEVIEPGRVVADFAAEGITIYEVRSDGDIFRGSIYLNSNADRSQLSAFLNSLPYQVEGRVFVKRNLVSAVTLVLDNLDAATSIVEIEDGIVALAGMVDRNGASDVSKAIYQDVPGIREVTFSAIDEEQTTRYMSNKIIGVWNGSSPYLIIKDGGIIRPGEEIAKDVSLISIESETEFLIGNGEKIWSYTWYE